MSKQPDAGFFGINMNCCTARGPPGVAKGKSSIPPWQEQSPGKSPGDSSTPVRPEFPPYHGLPDPSSMSKMLKENVKGILVNKSKREMKMGVRVAPRRDGSNEGVEVIEVHPSGPLATVIEVGDVLLRINGTLCDGGYEAAAIELRDTVGIVELVIIKRGRSGLENDAVRTIVDAKGPHGEKVTILVPRASLVAARNGVQLQALLNSAYTQATNGEKLQTGTVAIAYEGRDGSRVELSGTATFEDALNPFAWTDTVYVTGMHADESRPTSWT